ncbi:MAG: 3-demethylubiquinone-9 3-O-methyltransferase [Verrucomicrobia bacterium]|nr:3-demethylubiquinone-9 3-O-methyltransferase [Verrucomicrobiota bacterium]
MKINNDFYEDLREEWHTSTSHPIALLRAENRLRAPWIASLLKEPCDVLDIGCGAGFLSNHLAKEGHLTVGIDLSPSSLEVAKRYDTTHSVQYRVADAMVLPYSDEQFDVVCAMDILEHVEDPSRLIQEASRVLKKNGRFFFHTFNRNWWSWFVVIKGVDWCVPNSPSHMHVYPFFLRPSELIAMGAQHQLTLSCLQGVAPCLTKAFWRMIFQRRIEDDFAFRFTKSLKTGYCGYFTKQ